jgi:threonylcarbamoyladenosine tRNA methylthiotransferase MtaB
MSGPRVITLGCRLNAFEAEVMRQNAEAVGLADTLIVNTCTVTTEADRQARQTIRRLRRDNPDATIVVTGCAVQVDPGKFAAMPEVDRIVGNAAKLEAGSMTGTERVDVADIMNAADTPGFVSGGFQGRTRAFVQVQQGCDHRCTFCIVPFARGPNRSVDVVQVVRQVRDLSENGHAEVVLTGVDISSYGTDLAERPSLGALAGRILAEVPGLRRLRLSTLDPGAVDDDLIALFASEARLMPHVHLSLQAADDTVLKRMKRRHSRADAVALCRRLRQARRDVVFGADLIAGFPTESDTMFANTLAAIDEMDLTYLHVFPYSPRPDTPAARMPQVPPPLRKERAARLREAGDGALGRFLGSRVGASAEVLVERDRQGHCRHYAPVRLAFDAAPGSIVTTTIAGVSGDHLIGAAP